MKTKLEQCSLIALFVFAIGCGGDGEKAVAPAAATPSAAAPTPSSTALAAPAGSEAKPPTADELPLPEDFEAQVEATISAKTYKADFAELDREITKDCAQ